MKIFHRGLLLILIASFMPAYTQTRGGDESRISYSEYMNVIQKKLPELNRSTLTVETAEKNLLGAESASDVNFTGTGSYSRSTSFSGSTSLESVKTPADQYALSGALSKKILGTGTKLEAGTGYDYTKVDKTGYAVHTPSVYMKFTQSLLQNAFGVIDRFSRNDAQMKLDIEKLRKTETDKTYLNYYKKLYFTWIVQREKLALLKSSVARTNELADDIDRKVKAGLSDRLDIQTVRALLLQYEITYSEAKTELDSIESELSLFINTETLVPVDSEFSSYFNSTSGGSYSFVSYEKTKAAEIYRLSKNNLTYAADVQESRLLPQLDVTGQYTRKSNDTEAAAAYGNLDETEYYLGFAVTYPLQNSSGKSYVREAEIAVKSINNEFDISKKSYSTSLSSVIKKLQGIKASADLTERRISVLEAKYSAGYRQYLQSRQNLQFIIDTSLDITGERIYLNQLKNSMIQYSIDYADLTEEYRQ